MKTTTAFAQARRFGSGIGLAAALIAGPALAAGADPLVGLINDYRNSPQTCDDERIDPAGPLAPAPALAALKVAPGMPLIEALKAAGYQAAQAQVFAVDGPQDAREVLRFMKPRYCRPLLSARFAEIGVSREGDGWRVVLARPLLTPTLAEWPQAGREVLERTNAARAEPRTCGERRFGAAPPLAWAGKLGTTALAHSRDMAKKNFFRHRGSDGSMVAQRASREHYTWRQVGENIAAGQGSPEQVISAWLTSPTHCANIMEAGFTEMGAAYVVNPDSDGTIYWTQVFGTPMAGRR